MNLHTMEHQIQIEYWPKEFKPTPLPAGKIAVYMFRHNSEFLKIGKAGPKSIARFQSHHYHIKSEKSTLANSLIKDSSFPQINDHNVKSWILKNCIRYNILLDESLGKFVLNFYRSINAIKV